MNTYEPKKLSKSKVSADQPKLTDLLQLRGILKDVYASFGGGEAYLREIRRDFYGGGRRP
jgi:hypothetical protein